MVKNTQLCNMNINSITIFSIITFLLFQLFILKPQLERENYTNSFIKASQEYIKKIDARGEKRVVIIGNGFIFDEEGEAFKFQNKAIINPLREKLAEQGYTVIIMSLPCLEAECYSHYYNLGMATVALNPEAVVYHTISSGLNTDTINSIFSTNNIPVYTYGKELPIQYKLYVGPDNKKLGTSLGKGMLPEVSQGEKALYIETVRLINGDAQDNGYDRINAIRNIFTNAGIEEVDTLFTFWSKTKTYEEINTVLANNNDIDYIIVPSAETAEGAAEALNQRQLQNDIKILVLDFNPKVVELFKKGFIYAAVSQQYYKQSSALAAGLILGINNNNEELNTKKKFASGIITQSNLQDFLDEEGNYRF